MIPIEGDALHWLFLFAGSIFGLGVVATGWRLIVGPTLSDRVIALDLLGFLVLGVLCVFAIVTNTPPLLSVALVAGIILFLGTAAFAIFLQRRETQE